MCPLSDPDLVTQNPTVSVYKVYNNIYHARSLMGNQEIRKSKHLFFVKQY